MRELSSYQNVVNIPGYYAKDDDSEMEIQERANGMFAELQEWGSVTFEGDEKPLLSIIHYGSDEDQAYITSWIIQDEHCTEHERVKALWNICHELARLERHRKES